MNLSNWFQKYVCTLAYGYFVFSIFQYLNFSSRRFTCFALLFIGSSLLCIYLEAFNLVVEFFFGPLGQYLKARIK